MTATERTFRLTLQSMGDSLTTSLIASPHVWYCEIDDDLEDRLAFMRSKDYSQAPVRDRGAVVGVLHEPVAAGATCIADAMEPLSDRLLVSEQAPLRDPVRSIASGEPRYRLVVGRNGFAGIVTRSDLHKLPVRMLGFAFITHLESLMMDLIRANAGDEACYRLLAEGHPGLEAPTQGCLNNQLGTDVVRELKRTQRQMVRKGVAGELVETLSFGQKWSLVARLYPHLPPSFCDDMCDIQRFVRNAVAHTKPYVASDDELDAFEQRLVCIEEYIKRFCTMFHESFATGQADANAGMPA